MVALRRPDELPPPPEDGLPTRPIRPYALDKIHYWGNFLEAASTATRRAFSGQRVCADIFSSFGVCQDKDSGQRTWGSATVSLQVAVPFDLYFFNDLDPDAARAVATRARSIGVQGAQVFELDLRDPEGLSHAREIANVVVPFGPKIIVSSGDANSAHTALKVVAPPGRRYICSVIDPQSAIYEWRALEALAFREKAMDVLLLFPDEMDLGRGLAYYLREGSGGKLDRYFPPGTDWRGVAKASAHPSSALRRLYEERMETLLGFKIGHPKTVSMGQRALYRLVFASRNQLGIDIWNDICKRTRGEQYELPFLDV
jgi:three-Cys-motif partner protein